MSTSSPHLSCCIVGAGVIGLSVATQLKEHTHADITILAQSFDEDTTSNGSGGFWEPYQVGNTPEELINRWGKYSYQHFISLYSSPHAGEAGVQLFPAYFLCEEHELPIELPCWRNFVIDFRELSMHDTRMLGLPEKFVGGYSFMTTAAEQKYYLKWLYRNLESQGVVFQKCKINSLIDLVNSKKYDLVVNCAGLGAADLLFEENDMYPVRGQVLRVHAPWMKCFWQFGSSYLIPNMDNVVVGGTAQVGDYNTEPSIDDTTDIMNNICSVFPSLKTAPVEKVWAGLRPCRRSGIRMECNILTNTVPRSLIAYRSFESEDADLIPNTVAIAHCYGHGGCGVTLGMGCAHDLVCNHIKPLIGRRKQII